MLAPGPARPVDVDLEIFRTDLDVAVILDLGDHLDQGKGGVPTVRLVEGREANQPVHAALRPQPSEGALARDPDGHALVAGLFTRRLVQDLGAHLAPFRPAQVHAQQHVGPVLGVGPAGPGMDADQRRVLGVGVGAQQVDLLPADVLVENPQVLPQRGFDVAIALGDRHLGEADHIPSARLQLVPDRNLIAKALGFLREPLRPRWVLPEVGIV